ncbi:hypothetical protein D3C81_1625420 [compost metagenome]
MANLQIARIAFLTIDRGTAENNAVAVFLCLPDILVKTPTSAVQVLPGREFIGGQNIFLTVDAETSTSDTVGAAPGNRTEERMPSLISRQIVETHHDIFRLPMAIRHPKLSNDAAVIGHA